MLFTDKISGITALCQDAVVSENNGLTQIRLPKEALKEVLSLALSQLEFDYLEFISALDYPAENKIDVIYFLCANNQQQLEIKVALDRNKPEITTVSDIYKTADWHERETAELFGITFTGHPDPRKLLLPDDFSGFPLRKDFKDDFMLALPTTRGKE